jgi:uncharacterized protein (DUF488 family)
MLRQINNKYFYTIGHSNKETRVLIDLLNKYDIDLLIDVRSYPFSQHNPQFNKQNIEKELLAKGIDYLFLGNCLGGRPKDPTCYKGGEIPTSKVNYLDVVDYIEVSKRDWYNNGIEMLLSKARTNRVAIMCSEEDPNRCHRHHLIAKTLLDKGFAIKHIRGNGVLEELVPKINPEKIQQLQQLRFSDIKNDKAKSIQAFENEERSKILTNDKARKIYTIGFTKKTAKKFFEMLKDNHIEVLLDIRLKPQGQLAGFAKKDDLPYFLSQLVGCEYQHLLNLAPTEDILSEYKHSNNWGKYVKRFEALMDERDVPHSLDRHLFEEKTCCLLCSEAVPEKCHRRLVAERLTRVWPNIEVINLI